MKCEIYIQTSTRNPAVQRTVKARWLISSVLGNGQKQTRDGIVCMNNATAKQAALTALADALARFTKAAVIKIYISDDYVRNMCLTNMPMRWRANDWHKIRQNGTLVHSDLWQRVNTQLANHAVVFATKEECLGSYKLKELEDRLNGVKRML